MFIYGLPVSDYMELEARLEWNPKTEFINARSFQIKIDLKGMEEYGLKSHYEGKIANEKVGIDAKVLAEDYIAQVVNAILGPDNPVVQTYAPVMTLPEIQFSRPREYQSPRKGVGTIELKSDSISNPSGLQYLLDSLDGQSAVVPEVINARNVFGELLRKFSDVKIAGRDRTYHQA